ncbi:hypothetical protein GCM10010245_82210 [Streptomyces spectabilis]|nr:hypothetical protein GCM10010245_82210 [Streptomyces spectabilis]
MPAQAVANYRRRHQANGAVGLADHRPVRKKREFGLVADAVSATLKQTPAGQEAKMPSEWTPYRLLDKLTRNTHTFGSATTRRPRAHGASGEFDEPGVLAPGEVMQIDSNPARRPGPPGQRGGGQGPAHGHDRRREEGSDRGRAASHDEVGLPVCRSSVWRRTPCTTATVM